MSAWAAIVAREATVTASAGTGLLHYVAPSAIDGFAAGALLTGLCFIVVVAPRMRRLRLSGQPDPWPVRTRYGSKRSRHSYAAAADFPKSDRPANRSAHAGAEALISTYSAASAEAEADAMLQPGAGSPGSLRAAAPAGLGYLSASYESIAPLAPDGATAAPAAPAPGTPTPGTPATGAPTTGLSPAAGAGFAATWSARAESATPCVLAETVPSGWSFRPPPRTQFTPPAGSRPYADALGRPDHEAAPAPEPAPAPATSPTDRSPYRSKHRFASPETDRQADSRRNGPRHAAPSARFIARRSARLPVFPLPARG
jgi:hypothetical protein